MPGADPEFRPNVEQSVNVNENVPSVQSRSDPAVGGEAQVVPESVLIVIAVVAASHSPLIRVEELYAGIINVLVVLPEYVGLLMLCSIVVVVGTACEHPVEDKAKPIKKTPDTTYIIKAYRKP